MCIKYLRYRSIKVWQVSNWILLNLTSDWNLQNVEWGGEPLCADWILFENTCTCLFGSYLFHLLLYLYMNYFFPSKFVMLLFVRYFKFISSPGAVSRANTDLLMLYPLPTRTSWCCIPCQHWTPGAVSCANTGLLVLYPVPTLTSWCCIPCTTLTSWYCIPC